MAAPQPSEWSSSYARIQRLADREILRILRDAYEDATRMLRATERRGIGDAVRRQQIETVRRNLLREQATIFTRLGRVVDARRVEAAARAISLGTAVDTALLEAAGRTGQASALREAVEAGLRQTAQVAVTRAEVTRLPLSERIYRDQVWMNGRLNRNINSALARGLSAREFAAEARDWFRPNTPGGTRYASLRLARSEINNAFHGVSIQQANEKPWIDSMQWHLSRSHPKPDDCDKFAKGGPKGNGIYPKQDVPRKPHPNCFCFVTPVSPSDDDFLDGLLSGQYDSYLNSKIGAMRR